ncbi:MAG: hypothetical protein L3J75_02515 [Methylococcaceae bacterium]|nr:hypothetical protein [Methylococcaceae bacterium]
MLQKQGLRWVSGWVEQQSPDYIVNTVLEKKGLYLLARTRVGEDNAHVPLKH